MNNSHLSLINLIYKNEYIKHNEVMKILGWSRYKINKKIDEANDFFVEKNINIEISYKARIGLSIKGNSEEAENILERLEYEINETKDQRIVQVLSILLDAKGYIKIQQLANALYVSRTTIENVLENVRKLLEEYNIELIGSKNGIRLNVNERHKRQLIADVINSYKSKLVALENHKEKFQISLNFSNDVKKFINFNIVNDVVDIVSEFIAETNLYLTEYEFNSITIHISIMLDRIKKDFIVSPDALETELEPNTQMLIYKIETIFDIKLPQNEKENIDFYIKLIQQNNYNKSEYENKREYDKSTQLNEYREVTKMILSDIYPDNELIDDLSIHLKSAINRLKNNMSIRNPYLHLIKTQFIQSFETSKQIVATLESKMNISFDEDEIAYIAIHIQSFFERRKNSNNNDVILVCSSGYGTSKLLEQRLKNVFKEKINIVDVIGINKLNNMNIKDQLIITTVPIRSNQKNVVYVSPLLTNEDIESIGNLIISQNSHKKHFLRLLSNNLFDIDEYELTQEEVIKKLVKKTNDNNYTSTGVYQSIMNREKLSSTSMGLFAMPHAEIKYIKKPAIYVYINKEGVLWGNEKVNIVFLFLINQDIKNNINDVYKVFNEIIDSKELLSKLSAANDYDEFIRIITKEV
ncbi:Transcriptional antiterminator [Alkalibacterium gilvum]|uniref:Transcriptional antiterminator n=1 Tax=Alkalibacterium gilvum TaxID=1130080 RepID=A0A1H6V888_9LACT|nr:BglG family transcription antiterminator [Alkalibacterium gilvum]SEJ00849.1 Transcriptional antiterminator [Alkalibacterium gilvum]